MKHLIALAAVSLSLATFGFGKPDITPERESVTKLQIFLDSSPYKPGKIDGRWGGFTEKALVLYQKHNELGEVTFDGKDASKLPAAVLPDRENFVQYEIEQDDVDNVGDIPSTGEVEAKSKLDKLPYESLSELVAEKYHVDLDYFAKLNPGKDLAALKKGDSVWVPNVESPFEISDVKKSENDYEAAKFRIEISTTENQLSLSKDEKLVAVYPVSTGSKTTPAPKGDWEITSITFLPTFRWDKQMLEEGKRSDDAFILPPGANNPVGIVWMALDKDGIGIHGTNHPDTIGHADSHGCIRLSNWDAWDLANKIPNGVSVTIK